MKTLLLALLLLTVPVWAQDPPVSIRGQVTDPSGAGVGGATVDVQGPTAKKGKTDPTGHYEIRGLNAGSYSVVILKTGFEPFASSFELQTGASATLDASLVIAAIEEVVTVKDDAPVVSVAPDNNAGAIILKGQDLEALPDDPDEMSEALQALAGPSAGPNGGQIFIDGFTGGSLPPKSSIREIRINANPFSAEYDKLGYGRIEIFTKPGTDTFRGEAQIRYNDQDFNSRDPFAPNKPPYERTEWGGNVSGPIIAKKASFFVDFEKRSVRDNQVVNATVIDPDLQIVPFSLAVLTPSHRTSISPRIDWQVNGAHTLSVRYTYVTTDQDNAGVGGFSLPSVGYSSSQHQNTLQLIETSVYGKVINETRVRYFDQSQSQGGESLVPTLQVLDAFTGGGPSLALSTNSQKRFELQNQTTWSIGNHSLKAGVRLRTVSETDVARRDFAGTAVFTGGLGPELGPAGEVILGPNGQPIPIPLTSIDRYYRTLFLQQLGFAPNAIRALGGGASQLLLSGGNPEAGVTQWDVAPYAQDDWKVSANLVLSLGLRYELQDNISGPGSLAPRIGAAWSPGAKGGQAKTVIRGGFGVFYDRIAEDLALRSNHFNGTNTLQYLVTDPAVLGGLGFGANESVTGFPSVGDLGSFALPQQIWKLSSNIAAPYYLNSSLSIERQLPKNFTVSATFLATNGRRMLRSRNLNAPLADGTFPLGVSAGDVYQTESTGILNQYQGILGVNNRLSTKLTLFVRYFYGHALSDTDGSGTFPVNQYNLAGEYGRSAIDVRHRVILGGSIEGPYKVRFAPFLVASTGRPFNITVGQDLNGDSLFTDRPAFATDPMKPGLVQTAYGLLDPNPTPGEALIPRNFGTGPAFFVFNLRISRSIPIGPQKAPTGPDGPGGRGGGAGPFQPRGGGGGGGGFGGGGGGDKGLTLSISAQNLLNVVNPAAPVGDIASPLFGRSLSNAGGFGFGGGGASYAGNRRIEFQARYSF